jgi:hypothetical protein
MRVWTAYRFEKAGLFLRAAAAMYQENVLRPASGDSRELPKLL